MEIPMTPHQVAKELGVASVTVYKWVESKKLKATITKAGHTTRIWIDPKDVELKRIELAQSDMRVDENTPRPDADAMAWVRRYSDLIGRYPALYVAFRNGKATFEQMKSEALARFDQLR